MKKLYTFLTLVLISTLGFSQAYNGSGTDDLWSNTANWQSGTPAAENTVVNIWNIPTNIDIDETKTYKTLQNLAARTVDLTLSDAGGVLTLDVAGRTQFNASTDKGIWHRTTTATTFTIDTPIIINNSLSESGAVYDDWTSFKIEGAAGNVLEFGPNSTLTLGGDGGTGVYGDGIGEFIFNGTLTGTQVLGIGLNTTATFGSTFVNTDFLGGVTVYTGANITVNTPDGVKFSNKKLQANGTGAIVTLNNANVMGKEINIQGANTLDINVNANQSLSHFTTSGTQNGTLNLNVAESVTELNFWKNHLKDWGTATLNIDGYQEGVINFGPNTSPAGLTAQQLSQITINGQVPDAGNPLSLDATGHLVGASDLVLGVKDHSAFEFSVYPIPAKNELNINTQVELQNAKVHNLLGKMVLNVDEPSNRINVSSLNSGIYMLALTFKEGAVVNKKIIIK